MCHVGCHNLSVSAFVSRIRQLEVIFMFLSCSGDYALPALTQRRSATCGRPGQTNGLAPIQTELFRATTRLVIIFEGVCRNFV